jgi:hypothetical protein
MMEELETFESLHKNDVSKKALDTLEKVMFAQDDYGFDKYKKALKHSMDYDWLQMFLEEMADGLKYVQNELDRRETIKWLLYSAIDHSDWSLVQVALKLISKEGTGK